MPPVVQAKCPSCQKTLRIPADWLNQPVRCKHCGTVLHAKRKDAPPSSAPIPVKAPAPAPPSPAPDDLAFDRPADGPIIRSPLARRKRRNPWVRAAVALVALALVAGAGTFLYQRLGTLGWLEQWGIAPKPGGGEPAGPLAKGKVRGATGPFPRRLLAVGVNNYLYANPVAYGDAAVNFHKVTDRLASQLKIPADQVVELSDGTLPTPPAEPNPVRDRPNPKETPAPAPRPPLKAVVERTVTGFLDGCRPQDRIVLLFAGHAAEIDDTAYLVPLDGELTAKETLLPLSWLYDRLAQCKARQKVLILDVCRYDPGRGKERPGSDPMSAKLAAVLQKPPDGVQVWTACSAEQNSYELDGRGVFLTKLYEALEPKKKGELVQDPDDPLPLDALAQAVNRATEETIVTELAAKQTPALTGQAPADGPAYDPKAPPPPKVVVQVPPPPGGAAAKEQVKLILEEIDVPPIRQGQGANGSFELEALLPFSAKALEEYRPDYNSMAQLVAEVKATGGEGSKYPLRKAVLDAVKVLREAKLSLQETFAGGSNEKVKALILEEQRKPARAILELDEVLDKLRKVEGAREKETKRWQANYDYVLAQVLARLAYIHEYDLMLGKIRKDELPPLEKTHTGYRLSSRERIQAGREVRDLASESKKLLGQLVKEHEGTPWQILAKRDSLAALGLEWQPTR
jgi:hypothetical protein